MSTSQLNLDLEIVNEAALLSELSGTDIAPHCFGLEVLEENKGKHHLAIV